MPIHVSPTSSAHMESKSRDVRDSEAIFASTPTLPSPGTDDRVEELHDPKTKQRSWWKPASRHDSSRGGRADSVRTMSTTSSASTVFSKVSTSSRSTAASSTTDEHAAHISRTDASYDIRAAGGATKPPMLDLSSLSLDAAASSPGVEYSPRLDQRAHTTRDRLSPSFPPRTESRLDARAGYRSEAAVCKDPLAEVEMMPRKYAGYWRASFTAELPISAAICGCLLMVAGPGEFALT